MSKTKTVGMAIIVSLIMIVTGCNKKDDPRQMVYKAWNIEQVQMEGEEVGQEATRNTNVIEFTEKGIVKLIEGESEISGTFQMNEAANSITIVMDGSTDVFTISDLSETSMTLNLGEDRMVLKAKE